MICRRSCSRGSLTVHSRTTTSTPGMSRQQAARQGSAREACEYLACNVVRRIFINLFLIPSPSGGGLGRGKRAQFKLIPPPNLPPLGGRATFDSKFTACGRSVLIGNCFKSRRY